jgi:aryl-alcohol dehydrogenase-like predicted oxidoreductase
VKYRKVGKYGIKVSEISLGAWLTYGNSVDASRTSEIVKAAIEAGVNFIDLADIYAKGEAERVVGQAIEGYTRSDLVLSSKLFWPMSENVNDRGLSRKHIMESVEASLKRIGTDYLDFYFCHRFDKETEVEETVRAMSDLVAHGKVLPRYGKRTRSSGRSATPKRSAGTFRRSSSHAITCSTVTSRMPSCQPAQGMAWA